jgi:uncharacterized protein YjbI with pentapeptide repeats
VPANISQLLTDSHRVEHKDKAVPQDVANSDWSNLQLIRLVAIKRRFTKVSFANTTFDSCYLRDCQFDSCNFTGTKFSSTNLHGAKFTGCTFDYATFERTIIDDAILTDNCPAYENQKMRFARSLRTNYQQIGDAAAANRAIRVELDATEIHLRKAWQSNDHYYRKKYPGFLNRTRKFISWANFRLLDYIWGNGENLIAFFRTVAVLIAAIAILDCSLNPSKFSLPDAHAALWRAPQILLGIAPPSYISPGWLTIITLVRLIAFGLFMSILIKRFNRR